MVLEVAGLDGLEVVRLFSGERYHRPSVKAMLTSTAWSCWRSGQVPQEVRRWFDFEHEIG
jgi:hypothetical protein